MRRRTAWTGVAAVGALLAVACGGDGEGGADPVPTTQGVVPLVASGELRPGRRPGRPVHGPPGNRDLRPVAYGTVRLELRFLDETNPVPLESAGVPKGAIDSRGATTGKVPDPSCIASPWPRRSPTAGPPGWWPTWPASTATGRRSSTSSCARLPHAGAQRRRRRLAAAVRRGRHLPVGVRG